MKQTVVGDIIFAIPVPAAPSNKNTSNLSNLPTGPFSGPTETNSEKKTVKQTAANRHYENRCRCE